VPRRASDKNSFWLRTIALGLTGLLLVAACGGDDDDAASQQPDGASESPSASTAEPNDGTPEGNADGGLSLICEDPVPTEVGLGQPHSSDVDTQRCFWFDVPGGVDSLTVDITDVSVDMRVGVYYGYVWHAQFPGSANYWRGRGDGGEDIQVSIADPVPGPYFVYLNVGRAVTEFTLAVTTEPATTADPTGGSIAGDEECGGPARVIASGEALEGEVTARDRVDDAENSQHVYFCIEVPGGRDSFTVDLTNASSRFDVRVVPPNHEGMFLTAQGEVTGFDKSLTVDEVSEGAYYIDVSPMNDRDGGTFELTVTVR
jgi:hypothetical protein